MKCIRCGTETSYQRICYRCMNDWSEMRKAIWDFHEKKYGKLSPNNLKVRQKEIRKLEKLWRKDKVAFEQALTCKTAPDMLLQLVEDMKFDDLIVLANALEVEVNYPPLDDMWPDWDNELRVEVAEALIDAIVKGE